MERQENRFLINLFDVEGAAVFSRELTVPGRGFKKWNLLDFHDAVESATVVTDSEALGFRVTYVEPTDRGGRIPAAGQAGGLGEF
jgi:hypothetical protein